MNRFSVREAEKILARRGWLASSSNPRALVINRRHGAWQVADNSAEVVLKTPVTRRAFVHAIRGWYEEIVP